MIIPSLLVDIYNCPASRAEKFAAPLGRAMAAYNINTPKRIAAFLAQIGHESGRLKYTSELWGPTKQQLRYEPGTSLAKNLGNTHPGDGSKFRGHGLIQTTGRANHRAVYNRLKVKFPGMDVPNFEERPTLLAQPEWACLSACDYWDMRNLNKYADAGDFLTITKKINGGTNGLADRQRLYARAQAVLTGFTPVPAPRTIPAPTSQPVLFFERAA